VSRTITSPVKRFSGTVELADPLTFPQVFAFQDSLDAVKAAEEEGDTYRVNYAALPGIIACVEAWHLEGMPERVTIESFPATPPIAAARLIAWLYGEITKGFQDAETVPNE
jgi:hypothetical protein